MARPAPILLAYDGECRPCRRIVDHLQRRDRWGLVVTFPFQNQELLHVAPELAGRPLHLQIHGLDTRTRRVYAGPELLPRVLGRLPRWRFLAPLAAIPGAAALLCQIYLRIAARRCRTSVRI